MYILFYIVAFSGGFFFLLRRHQFDFVSAGFFGMIVYFMPGFYGFVINPYYVNEFPIEPIGWQTYLVWIVALTSITVAGVIYNPPKLDAKPHIKTDLAFDVTLIAILLISLVGSIIIGGAALFSPDKNDVLSVQGRIFILFSTSTQIAFVCFALQGKRLLAFIPALSVGLLVFIGYRLELAISAICVLTVLALRHGIKRYIRPKYLIPSVTFAALTFSYKFVSYAIRAGRYDVVVNTIFSGDFAQTVILKAEPFGTQAILNEVLLRNFTVPPESILYGFVALLPLSNEIFRFDETALAFNFQEILFSNLDYGLASNIYAHFYSSLGWMGIGLLCLIHSMALVKISATIIREHISSYVRLALILIGGFLAFYVHRNDLGYSITLTNRYIYVTLVVWLLSRAVATLFADKVPPPRFDRSGDVS